MKRSKKKEREYANRYTANTHAAPLCCTHMRKGEEGQIEKLTVSVKAKIRDLLSWKKESGTAAKSPSVATQLVARVCVCVCI